jgi:hypothetical protein
MNKLDEIIEKNKIQFLESNNNISINDLCKTVAIEFAKYILEEAAENVKFETEYYVNDEGLWDTRLTNKIAKESITSVINKYL